MNIIVILCDTLRRDHVDAYTNGQPLNQCWSAEAPDWSVPTPNMERLAARGTTFDNCYAASTPCMPARRDIYTGYYEFLERGWGPLEEDDIDLPRQVSGPPNQSIQWSLENDYRVSEFITDHFHMWEQGSGNYHMGYTGFEFVRGIEADAFYTAPVDFACPDVDRLQKIERHQRNIHFVRHSEEDFFCAQVFQKASAWLERNQSHKDFYLHLDIFDPHEPWDPPEDILKMFDPKGYINKDLPTVAPYAPWRERMTEEEFNNYRARYSAKVIFLDRWLGKFLDTIDRLDLWKDTLVILTSDHGTFNGDHGRIGKLQTHEFDAKAHIPFILAHPHAGQGERRNQLVQLVDIFPTVLTAVGRPLPEKPVDKPLHGIDLLPLLEDPDHVHRDYAIMGMFGKSISITDGEWTLHQSPIPENEPLNWYGYSLAKFIDYNLGPYQHGHRPVSNCASWPTMTWLSNKRDDPNELVNLAADNPIKVLEMQHALKETLTQLKAPPEQIQRLGLDKI